MLLKKLATTLNLVLCLLVMYLAVNCVTHYIRQSPGTWIVLRRTPALYLLDLYHSKIMNC